MLYDAQRTSHRLAGLIGESAWTAGFGGMTFPNARDCEHGRQRGKCPECEAVADIADLTVALESSESRERALRDEVKRMRDRIERLRGALKTASGRFLDAGHLVSANDCMQWAGDMEPPIMGSNA